MATKNQNQLHKFMIEPKYDLLLNNNQRFLILGSGKKKEEVQVRVYNNNRLCKDSNIELVLKFEKNAGSPTVAWWSTPNTNSNNGIAICFVETLDLENCKEGVEDPILPKLPDNDKLNIIMENYLGIDIMEIISH